LILSDVGIVSRGELGSDLSPELVLVDLEVVLMPRFSRPITVGSHLIGPFSERAGDTLVTEAISDLIH